MKMRITNVFLVLLIILSFPLISHSEVSIMLSYPHSAFLDQKITIGVNVLHYINSTDFTIVSNGTKIIDHHVYTGTSSGGSYAIFPTNVSLENVSQIIVTFVGKYSISYLTLAGIILYEGNFKPTVPDVSQGNFDSIMVTFNGKVYYEYFNPKDNSLSLVNPVSNLPHYGELEDGWINVTTPVNYTVVFENDNGSTLIKEIFLNGKIHSVNYLSPIPWNFSYVGIRIDSQKDFISPIKFVASFPLVEKYILYINNKEYTSGFTNSLGKATLTLKITSPLAINISFPYLHEYRVITVNTIGNPNIKASYPIMIISILTASIILSIVSFIMYWKSQKKV